MLSTWSSPAPHLNLSLPKEQWEPCSHPEMPAQRDALPGKAPASPGVLEWSVNGLKAGIQSFPNHHKPTFGGKPGREQTEPLHLPCQNLAPGPLSQQVPVWGRARAGSQDNARSLNTLPGCCQLSPRCPGTPTLAFWSPAPCHQPAGSLCDVPACG